LGPDGVAGRGKTRFIVSPPRGRRPRETIEGKG